MNFWLVKTEPDTYSIENLKEEEWTRWDGVRNYQARNFMRDDMKTGDRVLIYHSNIKDPVISGEARVCSESYPDPTQFDERSDYYDEKARENEPRWFLVDLCYVKTFKRAVTRSELKDDPVLSTTLPVLQKGNRLSIQPITKDHYDRIKKLSEESRGVEE